MSRSNPNNLEMLKSAISLIEDSAFQLSASAKYLELCGLEEDLRSGSGLARGPSVQRLRVSLSELLGGVEFHREMGKLLMDVSGTGPLDIISFHAEIVVEEKRPSDWICLVGSNYFCRLTNVPKGSLTGTLHDTWGCCAESSRQGLVAAATASISRKIEASLSGVPFFPRP